MSSETRIYAVPGISCEHCRQTIEGGLGGVDGVTAVSVDLPARKVQVEGSVSPDTVRQLLTDLGYEVDDSSLV